MKRTLLSITVALMALTMFFASCQDPLSDYSVENKAVLPEIAGPEWVKAEALPGANHITWAYNKDAAGYAIYRQEVDTAGKELSTFFEVGTTSLKTGEYLDAVSRGNQLKDKALYKYGVVAFSKASLARSVDYVKDGVTYADAVTANIPAQGTEILKLKTPDYAITIHYEAVQSQEGQQLLVSWESPHPAFEYAVSYALGNATLSKNIVSSEEVVGDPIKYFYTPLFGGTTQISLGVAFAGDQYYYKPALLTQAVTGLTLTQPFDFTPSSFNVNRSGGYAGISWRLNTIAPNRSDYKLFRIETKGVYSSGSLSNTVELVGDWAEVTGISDTREESGYQVITVTDTGLESGKNYLYGLYAEVGGRKSYTALYGIKAEEVSLAELDFDVKASYTETADVRTYSATIGWNAAEGVLTGNYKLERAITAEYPTKTTGAFTVVSATPATPTAVGGRYTVIDTPLTIRQSYVYRLTATVNGVDVISYKSLSEAPFREYDETTSAYTVSSSSIGTAYATEISFSLNTGYDKDITADIYRAVVPANSSISTGLTTKAYEEAAFTKLTTTAAHAVADGDYIDYLSSADIDTQYIYRVEYKAGGQPLYLPKFVDSDDKTYTGYVQTPSVPYYSSQNLVGTPSYGSPSVTRQYYTISGTNIFGAQIISQSRKQSTGGDWGTGGGISTTVASYTPAAGTTDNLKWGTGAGAPDTGVGPNNEYFYFVTPTAVADTEFRLVLVNNTDPQSYTVLINF
jgi:hypothetical protein